MMMFMRRGAWYFDFLAMWVGGAQGDCVCKHVCKNVCTPTTKKRRWRVSCVWLTYGETVKKRINLSIDPRLHAWAQDHAERRGTNLSAYVAELLEKARQGAQGEVILTPEERVVLRREITEDVLKALIKPSRAG